MSLEKILRTSSPSPAANWRGGFESLDGQNEDYGKRHEDDDAKQTDEADDCRRCPQPIGNSFGCMRKDASCATY